MADRAPRPIPELRHLLKVANFPPGEAEFISRLLDYVKGLQRHLSDREGPLPPWKDSEGR